MVGREDLRVETRNGGVFPNERLHRTISHQNTKSKGDHILHVKLDSFIVCSDLLEESSLNCSAISNSFIRVNFFAKSFSIEEIT